mmetsp:Transcript_49855/g.166601  ORF Transcript_49855/g.166601 Transcript_49855/m.166601 type:complete len:296 (-) Transcript_49855:401-1288(-)
MLCDVPVEACGELGLVQLEAHVSRGEEEGEPRLRHVSVLEELACGPVVAARVHCLALAKQRRCEGGRARAACARLLGARGELGPRLQQVERARSPLRARDVQRDERERVAARRARVPQLLLELSPLFVEPGPQLLQRDGRALLGQSLLLGHPAGARLLRRRRRRLFRLRLRLGLLRLLRLCAQPRQRTAAGEGRARARRRRCFGGSSFGGSSSGGSPLRCRRHGRPRLRLRGLELASLRLCPLRRRPRHRRLLLGGLAPSLGRQVGLLSSDTRGRLLLGSRRAGRFPSRKGRFPH